jgi:hypothetical protein
VVLGVDEITYKCIAIHHLSLHIQQNGISRSRERSLLPKVSLRDLNLWTKLTNLQILVCLTSYGIALPRVY